MPEQAWSAKRERQDAHVKGGLIQQGKPPPLAEEIAARVVNKELAQHGESLFNTRAANVMSREFNVRGSEDLVSEVLAMMQARGPMHVLLVDPGNVLSGIVNARDGLRVLLDAGNQEEALLRNYVMEVAYR